jgi:hypothetical protein
VGDENLDRVAVSGIRLVAWAAEACG